MPPQKTVAKFDLNKAITTHAHDETDYGTDFTRPPGGISGGIARLVECKIDLTKKGDNAGKPHFRAAGIIVSPVKAVRTTKRWNKDTKKVEIVSQVEERVAGMRTSLFINLFDTGSGDRAVSADDHVKEMMNELRKLFGEEFRPSSEEEINEMAKTALEGDPIYFRFGTRDSDPNEQYPESRTFETWYGNKGLEDFVPETAPAVTDNSGSHSSNGSVNGTASEPEPEPATDDLDELVTRAEANDAEAQKRLKAICDEAGVTSEEWDAAGWTDIPALVATAKERAEGGGETTTATAEVEPKVEDIYFYRPIDPKTKKPRTKSIEVSVKTVDKKNKTVSCVDVDTKKTVFKGVAWADLLND